MERPYIATVEQAEWCLGVVAPGPSHVSLKDFPAGLTKHGSIKSSRPFQTKKAKPFTPGIAQPKTKKASHALSLGSHGKPKKSCSSDECKAIGD